MLLNNTYLDKEWISIIRSFVLDIFKNIKYAQYIEEAKISTRSKTKLTSQLKNEKYSFYYWGFNIFDKWIQIKNCGISLADFCRDNLLTRVAIYGIGTIGKRLYEELKKEQINVVYGIDRNSEKIHLDSLVIKTLSDELPIVDAIIVTPISFYEIEKDIHQKMGIDVDIIFIEDVIEYCYKKIL